MLILLKLQLALDSGLTFIDQLQLLSLFKDIFEWCKAIVQMFGGDINVDESDIRCEGDLEDVAAIDDVLKRQRYGS